MPMRRIAFMNQKGGVGKTTTCVNLGAALTRRGMRVLLLDMDPQANLTVHLDDGRSFVRHTEKKFDLVLYGVVDSLVLHSGYSSIRLESFLFTEQALRDIKARLKPGGVFAMYNFYRQGWVIGRLKQMAERAFGTDPLVISLPYQERIAPTDQQGMHITFLMVGNPQATVLDAIRREYSANRFFWGHERVAYSALFDRFR